MKCLNKMMAVCIVVLSSYTTQSQILTSGRPNYFNKYAEKLPTTVTELDKAFKTSEGGKIKINFSDFSFNGIVTSSIRRYDNLYSVIIKSPGLNNTLLSISKRINDDKTVTYVGRMINEQYADGFELRRDNDGKYAINKVNTDALIEDY
ncbi:MAG: hypothetical protein ABI288_01170 [Ginsengibacter sp.]